MYLQKMILNQFMEIYKNPFLREIENETGIQITRIFRLFNGSAMKLDEYQRFQESIRKKKCGKDSLQDLIETCSSRLPINTVREIELLMIKRLHTFSLKNKTINPTENKQLA